MAADPRLCSLSSLAAGEPLAGTAVEGIRTFVMVEVGGAWGAKVPQEAGALTAAVRDHLVRLDGLDGVRVGLCRRPGDGARATAVTVACLDAVGSAARAALARAEDLLQLRAPSGGDPLTAGISGLARLDRPQFFVCTHGTRDACCARLGMPVYARIDALAPDRTFQCSHLGGHRFAATLVVLPLGIVYGRVTPELAEEIVAASDRGEIADPEWVRGNVRYGRLEQAAEMMLRRATGERRLAAVQWAGTDRPADAPAQVRFSAPGGDHLVQVREVGLGPVLVGCTDGEPTPMRRVELVGLERGS
jgi:(2Fe-2S) ferredoxin